MLHDTEKPARSLLEIAKEASEKMDRERLAALVQELNRVFEEQEQQRQRSFLSPETEAMAG